MALLLILLLMMSVNTNAKKNKFMKRAARKTVQKTQEVFVKASKMNKGL